MKRLLLLCLLVFATAFYFYYRNETAAFDKTSGTVNTSSKKAATPATLKTKTAGIQPYLKQAGFSTHYVFLIDMSLPSGQNRFFIYDLQKSSVAYAGLVAHGSCNTAYLPQPRFSNEPDCGCSSIGRYKIGYAYNGRFGKAYKLFGLDSSNANAFKRAIVLHAYDCVPDVEITSPLCNSLGCPMVSYKFLDTAARIIEASAKPVLLWIYK